MTAPVLVVEHLQKNFGKFQALKDINLTLNPGEVLGFIGPNGAGKSTTIRVLLGILKKSGGSAQIFSEDVSKNAVSIHKRLAYVPVDVNLWPNLTGGEMIDFFLALNGQKHFAKTDELIKLFELDTKKKCRTYSKGNRQKVALISVFSTEADLFIFDEPTSGLDPLMEELFQKEVAQLKAQNKSILLSSHILSEVEKMCDQIAIIKAGEIVESGSLTEMQQLSRTKISVTTSADLSALKNSEFVHSYVATPGKENIASFLVDSDHLQEIMTSLTDRGIVSLQTAPPTLEDLFLRYYESDGEQSVSQN